MRNDAIAAMIGERAVLYLRVSSDQQEANTSFESQEREGRRWCAEQGMEVVAVFRDTHTGAELWERKGLQAARECLRRRDAGVLVALAIDRLTRDSVHLGILIEEAERVGARIAFVQEPLDTSPEGMLLQHVRGYAAAVEREKFRGRTMLAKRTRVARHQLLPSNRELFGYRWADETKGRYVVDPERAPIVERLFRERAGGASFRQLAAALNADHITTSAGKPWGPSSVQYTLSHPAYKGEAFAFRSKNTRERSEADPSRKVTRCVLRPSDEWVKLPDGTIPALVPADLWQAAQEASTRGPARGSRPPIDPEVVLLRGGYARCGYCGGSMTANRPGGKRKVANIRYQCSERSRVHKKCPGGGHSINAAIIDAAALDRIEAILTKPEVMRAALLRYLGDDPTGADLEAIDRREAQIERKIGNLVGSLEDLTGAAGRPGATDRGAGRRAGRDQGATGRLGAGTRHARPPGGLVSGVRGRGRADDLPGQARRPGGVRHTGYRLGPGPRAALRDRGERAAVGNRPVAVVPVGGPPGVGEETERVAPRAQELERLAGAGLEDGPAVDGAGVAVQRGGQLDLVDVAAESAEAVAQDAGGRPAPVLAIHAVPVGKLGGAHRGDVLLTRGPRGVGQRGGEGIPGERPAAGGVLRPVRPVDEGAAEIEDDGARRRLVIGRHGVCHGARGYSASGDRG